MRNRGCCKSASWVGGSCCFIKPAVLKEPSLGTKSHRYTLLYHGVALAHFVHIRTDEGQVEDGAQDRYSSDEAHYDWEEPPEQQEEAVDLQHDSDDGPANQHHEHASQEETGGLHLVLLEEEAERPLQPDDEGESSNEQDISNSQECFIEEQDHPEEEEKHAEAC